MPVEISRRAAAVQLPIIPVVADWIRAHPGTVSLGQGVVGYAPPASVREAVERLAAEPGLNRYQAVAGLPELVEALRGRLERRHGIRAGGADAPAGMPRIVVSAGSNAAFLEVIFAICDPGDEVILPVPYFFNQEMALTLCGVRPVLVPCDVHHQPDPERLAAAMGPRTRAVVTVSPNNPSGAVYPEATLRAINRLCRERGVFHISDEAYEAFVHGECRHVSPGSFPGAAGHTVSLFSFSKSHGFASWRVGYAVVPGRIFEAMRKIQDTNLICAPVVSQLAALQCLEAGDAWVEDRRRELVATRRIVLERLGELAEWAEVGPADGAFYVLLRLRRWQDPLELTRELIVRHRVAVIPGTAFGLDREAGCQVRVAYGALDPRTADEGLGRLVAGVRDAAGRLGR